MKKLTLFIMLVFSTVSMAHSHVSKQNQDRSIQKDFANALILKAIFFGAAEFQGNAWIYNDDSFPPGPPDSSKIKIMTKKDARGNELILGELPFDPDMPFPPQHLHGQHHGHGQHHNHVDILFDALENVFEINLPAAALELEIVMPEADLLFAMPAIAPAALPTVAQAALPALANYHGMNNQGSH